MMRLTIVEILRSCFSMVPLASYILIIDVLVAQQTSISLHVIIVSFIAISLTEWIIQLRERATLSQQTFSDRTAWIQSLVCRIYLSDFAQQFKLSTGQPWRQKKKQQDHADSILLVALLLIPLVLEPLAFGVSIFFIGGTLGLYWLFATHLRTILQSGEIAEKEHNSLARNLRLNGMALRARLDITSIHQIYNQLERTLFSLQERGQKILFSLDKTAVLFHRLCTAGLLFLCAHLVVLNELSLGGFFGCNIALMRMQRPTFHLARRLRSYCFHHGKSHNAANRTDTSINFDSRHNRKPISTIKEIQINKLIFCFQGYEDLFHDLCANFPTDKPIFISGKSGAGKTTLLRLIAGLYGPSSGKICKPEPVLLIDGLVPIWMFSEDRPTELKPSRKIIDQLAGQSDDINLDILLSSQAPDALSRSERYLYDLITGLSRSPECILLDDPISSLGLPLFESVMAGIQIIRPSALIVIADRIDNRKPNLFHTYSLKKGYLSQ